MANLVGSASQLSTFSAIRTIMKKSSILNAKFGTDDYYEYEPATKGGDFNKHPYIVINDPQATQEEETFNSIVRFKEYPIIIELVVEYSARSNFVSYANAVIDVIEKNESDLESSGYYNTKIDFNGSDVEIINQHRNIRGTFTLGLDGTVSR